MLKTIFIYFKNKSEQSSRDAQLMRLAQVEYPKDWEYVYYMYSLGKQPYTED